MDKGNSDERLLKLIEGSAEERSKQNSNLGKKLLGSPFPDKFKNFFLLAKKLKLNLLDFDKALIVIASLITLIFVFKLFSSAGPSESVIQASDKGKSAAKIAVETQDTVRKLFPSQNFKRNFFLPFGVKPSGTEDGGVDIAAEVKDLKLVGIIWSDNPDAMIEDSKEARTYTLKKGDLFSNGKFKIKDITSNSVTLEIHAGDKALEYVLR